MNNMPSLILQNIYQEVLKEHSQKSPTPPPAKSKIKSIGGSQPDLLFSENSVSQINQFFTTVNDPPPKFEAFSRPFLKTYTMAIEEEDSLESFEVLSKIDKKPAPPIGKSPFSRVDPVKDEPIPSPFLDSIPNLLQESNSETPLKTKSVIKKQGSVKFGGPSSSENSNKKTIERTLSLPPQKVTFAFQDEDDDVVDVGEILSAERLTVTETKSAPIKEKIKSPARKSLKQAVENANSNKNKRNPPVAKINKGKNKKALEKALSLLPKKSHFFYISQSFNESSENPSVTKLPEKIIDEEEDETPVADKKKNEPTTFEPLVARPISECNASPIKHSSPTKENELYKKFPQVASYNTSFDHEELFPAKVENSLSTPPERNHGSPCFEYSTIDDGETMADKLDAALRRRAESAEREKMMMKESRRFTSSTPRKAEELKSPASPISPICPASPANASNKRGIDQVRLSVVSAPRSLKASPRLFEPKEISLHIDKLNSQRDPRNTVPSPKSSSLPPMKDSDNKISPKSSPVPRINVSNNIAKSSPKNSSVPPRNDVVANSPKAVVTPQRKTSPPPPTKIVTPPKTQNNQRTTSTPTAQRDSIRTKEERTSLRYTPHRDSKTQLKQDEKSPATTGRSSHSPNQSPSQQKFFVSKNKQSSQSNLATANTNTYATNNTPKQPSTFSRPTPTKIQTPTRTHNQAHGQAQVQTQLNARATVPGLREKVDSPLLLKMKNEEQGPNSHRTSPDKSISKIWLEMDDFKNNDSESFLEDAKQLDGMINQANLAAKQKGKVETYVELDADYFEPFMKAETVERLNTPSRICLKIIDKLLEEPDASPTSLASAFKLNSIAFTDSLKSQLNRTDDILKSDRSGKYKDTNSREIFSAQAQSSCEENPLKGQRSSFSAKSNFYNGPSPKKHSIPNYENSGPKQSPKVSTTNQPLSKNGSKANILENRNSTPPAKYIPKHQQLLNSDDYKKTLTPKRDGPKAEYALPKPYSVPGKRFEKTYTGLRKPQGDSREQFSKSSSRLDAKRNMKSNNVSPFGNETKDLESSSQRSIYQKNESSNSNVMIKSPKSSGFSLYKKTPIFPPKFGSFADSDNLIKTESDERNSNIISSIFDERGSQKNLRSQSGSHVIEHPVQNKQSGYLSGSSIMEKSRNSLKKSIPSTGQGSTTTNPLANIQSQNQNQKKESKGFMYQSIQAKVFQSNKGFKPL